MDNCRDMSVRIKIFKKPSNDDLREDAVGELVKTVWAKKLDMSSSEFFGGGGFNGKNVKKFRIRYTGAVRQGMRLEYMGEIYKITGALEEDVKSRKKWKYLIAERISDEG